MVTFMIKKTAVKLAVIILLTAINSCYYEREINEELEICFERADGLYIMNIDGSNQRKLTDGADDDMPSWSPDGKRILFQRAILSTPYVHIINSDRTNLKRLSTIQSTNPTWSADGEKIHYYENNGSYSIVSAKPDGTIIRRYTIATYPPNSLSASPDGKYIYYIKNNASYRLDLITGVEDQFTSTVLDQGSISPDGNNIAYENGSSIYIYNIKNNTSSFLISSAFSPCWTPDGKTIVYQSMGQIYSINIDSLESKPLTTSNDCYNPCVKWKPR